MHIGILASTSGAAAGVLVIIVIGLYFIPTVVAAVRKVPNVGSVAVINVFLGWSLIGWVVALAMASRSQPLSGVNQAQVTVVGSTSATARHCVHCGAGLPKTGQFCAQCGSRFAD